MKNQSFIQHLRFAVQGIRCAWSMERSFRIQVIMGLGAVGILFYFHAEPYWWAIFSLVIGVVLAAELINTALEKTLDLLHPEKHPMVKVAKDCAAGAVLILSFSAVGILIAFIFTKMN